MQHGHRPYICESTIASGGFATVYRARHRFAQIRVAMKVIDQDRIVSDADRTHLIQQIDLLRQMDHPFIAKLFCVLGETDSLAIIQEYAPNSTMFDYITQYGARSEPEARYYFMQLVAVIECLHSSKKVAHREFK
jgi:MAP/microtubule affinity-regulating kinase